jgi:hypothetical protein
MIIERNCSRIVEIYLFDNNTDAPISLNLIEKIEFTFGKKGGNSTQIIKYYPNDVNYDAERNVFLVPITQQESIRWTEKRLPVQLRVKYLDGSVIPTNISTWDISDTLSNEVM